MFGLCVSPGFVPTQEELDELKPLYLRTILYGLDNLSMYENLGVPLIITLNNQCKEVGSDWSGWDNTVYEICNRLQNKLLLLGAGNEFDLYWMENGSVSPEFGADIARRAARMAHNYNIKVAATSVASAKWPEYLETLSRLCRNDVDYFDIHPYGKRPDGWYDERKGTWMFGDLKDTIRIAYNIAQKDIVCTEYGVKIRDAGNPIEVANFLRAADTTLTQANVRYKCWFAYTDAVGAPSERGLDAFGLLSDKGVKRYAWSTFAEINQRSIIVPPVDWSSKVGKGLLDMMRQDNTTPAMASEWRPFDRPQGTPATIEQCIGLNNVTYCWNLNTSSGWRIRPT